MVIDLPQMTLLLWTWMCLCCSEWLFLFVCVYFEMHLSSVHIIVTGKLHLNLYTPVATNSWILTQFYIALTPIFSLQETYEAKRKEFLVDLQRKEEEMRQMFVNKVKETEAELKEKEKEVRMDIFIKLFFGKYVACGLPYVNPFLALMVSSFTRGLSSSNGCTRKRRRLWRRSDENWRKRWTLSIGERLQLRHWWDRRSKAAHSPSKRTRTRRSKSASLNVSGYLIQCCCQREIFNASHIARLLKNNYQNLTYLSYTHTM